MAIVVNNAGAGRVLELLAGKTAIADLTLHLYSNNLTPGESDVLGSFTEVTGGGYAPKTLTNATGTVTVADPAQLAYPQQTFAFSSVPGVPDVYGYYVRHGSIVVYAERLASAPFTITAAGDEVRVTPVITGD